MILYFDCFSGVSGDMTLGGLLDLGVPLDWLRAQLSALSFGGFEIAERAVVYNGIRGRRVEVRATDPSPPHRHYGEIRDQIARAALAEPVRRRSLSVFRRLAEAEAAVHGCTPEEVHFHEVGAVDAIVDVVGCALGLEYLGVEAVYASPIPNGRGFVACRHGRLPIPAPATQKLLEGVPTYGVEIEAELTTPTGAAIVTALCRRFGPMPPMVIRATGYGAGSQNLAPGPNLLRLVLGEPQETQAAEGEGVTADRVTVLEAAVDDMNPEWFGYLMERLFEEGALDVLWIPVQMKKNRPGTLIQVLCRPEQAGRLARRVLTESTTLGVRLQAAERLLLSREIVPVASSFGSVPMKRVVGPDGAARLVPEFEACRAIARSRGIPLREVYERLLREAEESPPQGPPGGPGLA